MAVKTQAQLLAQVASLLADNTTGDISPSDVRTCLNDIIDSASYGGKKVYKALLTQTGTNAPVATVLENTLSGTPVWSYVTVGQFACTLASEFTEFKTFISNTSSSGEYAGETGILFSWSDVNSIYMEAFKDAVYSNGTPTIYLAIEVYP